MAKQCLVVLLAALLLVGTSMTVHAARPTPVEGTALGPVSAIEGAAPALAPASTVEGAAPAAATAEGFATAPVGAPVGDPLAVGAPLVGAQQDFPPVAAPALVGAQQDAPANAPTPDVVIGI